MSLDSQTTGCSLYWASPSRVFYYIKPSGIPNGSIYQQKRYPTCEFIISIHTFNVIFDIILDIIFVPLTVFQFGGV